MSQNYVEATISIVGVVVFYAFLFMGLSLHFLRIEVKRLAKQVEDHVYPLKDRHVREYHLASLQADIDRLRRESATDVARIEKRLDEKKTRPVVTEIKKEL